MIYLICIGYVVGSIVFYLILRRNFPVNNDHQHFVIFAVFWPATIPVSAVVRFFHYLSTMGPLRLIKEWGDNLERKQK